MQPASYVRGTVLNPKGDPIAGARIMSAVEKGGLETVADVTETMSSSDGRFDQRHGREGSLQRRAVQRDA